MQSALDSTQQPPTWSFGNRNWRLQWETGRERKKERDKPLNLHCPFFRGSFMGGKETPSQNENRRMQKEQITDRLRFSLLRETYARRNLNLTMGLLRQGEKCSSDIMLCLVHAGFIKWSICLLMCLLLRLSCVNIFWELSSTYYKHYLVAGRTKNFPTVRLESPELYSKIHMHGPSLLIWPCSCRNLVSFTGTQCSSVEFTLLCRRTLKETDIDLKVETLALLKSVGVLSLT